MVEKHDCKKFGYQHCPRGYHAYRKNCLNCGGLNNFKVGCKISNKKKAMNICNNYDVHNISKYEILFDINSIVVLNIYEKNNCKQGWFFNLEINNKIISVK